MSYFEELFQDLRNWNKIGHLTHSHTHRILPYPHTLTHAKYMQVINYYLCFTPCVAHCPFHTSLMTVVFPLGNCPTTNVVTVWRVQGGLVNLYNMATLQQIRTLIKTKCDPWFSEYCLMECTVPCLWLCVTSVSCLPPCAQSFILLSVSPVFFVLLVFSNSLFPFLWKCCTPSGLTAFVIFALLYFLRAVNPTLLACFRTA